MAQDLHDGVLQSLTGIRLDIALGSGLDSVGPIRDRLFAMGGPWPSDNRSCASSSRLRPHTAVRDDTPLAARLHTLLERIACSGAPVTVAWIRDCDHPERLEQAVPLMVHEAVVSALKHGQPSSPSASTARQLRIIVDDGRGFPFHGRYDHEALVDGDAGPKSLLSA